MKGKSTFTSPCLTNYSQNIWLHNSAKRKNAYLWVSQNRFYFRSNVWVNTRQNPLLLCFIFFFSRRHKSKGQFPTDIATTSTSVNKCSNKFSFSVISHTFLHFPNPKQLLHYEKYSLFFCCIWVDKYDIFLSIKVDVSFALTWYTYIWKAKSTFVALKFMDILSYCEDNPTTNY